MFDIQNLASVQVGLASPDEIREWSHGEVTKPETINYRSQKPEMGGLFCERIFGPSKDYECHCGKYKKIRFAGITCEKCGVEVISKAFRRERMGHIELVSPCTHIWYLKGVPSRIGLVLDISPKQLEEVAYFTAHIVLNPGTSKVLKYKQFLNEKAAREVFPDVLLDFKDEIEEGSADALRLEELIQKIQNPRETFDFFTAAAFISKYTHAEFGEGAAAIKRLLHEVDINKEFDSISAEMKECSDQKRLRLAKRLGVIGAFRDSLQKPEWMVLDVIPVIPPDLRPMLQLDGGRFAASDLNDLYRRVISRNNRLKKLIDMNAPYVILMNEKRMLQEAVDALLDNGRRNKPATGPSGRPLKSLSSTLKGKQGRFRQNLLGKRVDYSGRSVIAVGPDLKIYQCGLPREMAISLLRPFIAAILIRDGYVTAHKQADKIIDRREPIVNDIIERIISEHPVLLNRAPTLHRLSIQAFQPKLVEGRAIRLHPLVCTGFNADFDGDQMAVHIPLSKAAQMEALDLMLASNNILSPRDGKPIVIPGQDMIIGNYYLTIEENKADFLERAARNRKAAETDGVNAAADLAQAEEDERFASCEGKVFSSVNEVILAYESGLIHIHNRIALPAEKVNKTFGSGLPLSAKGKYLITSVGKVIFNKIFPDDFPWINQIDSSNEEDLSVGLESYLVPRGTDIPAYIADRPLSKPIRKNDLVTIIGQVFNRYGTGKTSAVLDKIKDQGFKFSTASALTIAISDIQDIDGKQELVDAADAQVDALNKLYRKGFVTNAERHERVTKIWEETTNKIKEKIAAKLPHDKFNPITIMEDSGARGNLDNIKQLIGMKGCVSNPKNEIIELPIVSSYRDGLKVSEFFINTHGARKGGADTALKTSDSGYLTRRLVDVSQDVIVREEDCHCDHGFKVREIRDTAQNRVVVPLQDRLVGRFAMHDVINPQTGELIVAANTMFDEQSARKVVECGIKEVEIRSVLTCQSKGGVCQRCYGQNMATGRLVEVGEAVGIMAAQSIGEPGTQLTMRVFHTGGIAGTDITQGLPRVQELVEARSPKGEALISEISGRVSKIEREDPSKASYNVTITNDLEEKIYKTGNNVRLRVKEGDLIENGAKITEGAIKPDHLLEVSDPEKVEVYIMKEIHKVYSAQGIGISDKHIEIIVRQMLRKLTVIDSGDTNLLPGAKVSLDKFTEANQEVLLQGKRPAVARPCILGITKAALGTDSFLSAASFQETTRVLTDAAVKGKRDNLHGLKENVIAGKLIPAGTGLLSPESCADKLAKFSVVDRMGLVKAQYVEAHDRPLEDS